MRTIDRRDFMTELAAVTVGSVAVPGVLSGYLAAHRQYSNSSALAVPGGAVRNAAAAAPGR